MPALHFFKAKFAIAGAFTEARDFFLDCRDGFLVRVPHDRHHKPALCADRDADVVVVLVNDVLAVNFGVHAWDVMQSVDTRFHKKAHEAELHAVLLLEQILVALAHIHDRGHVHLVERGEHGGGVLRFLEPAGDRLAQLGHAHALFPRLGGRRIRRARRLRRGRLDFCEADGA